MDDMAEEFGEMLRVRNKFGALCCCVHSHPIARFNYFYRKLWRRCESELKSLLAILTILNCLFKAVSRK
jgi:hypothetical protein